MLSVTPLGQDIIGEAEDDASGWSVSLSANGTVVAIGACLNDGSYDEDSGHVHVCHLAPHAMGRE